ncbi:MAG TPA: M12 family metallo-peptidase [Xanthomonadaceae bacterium]|nr:M12 family metallo-peptidase [Xanthomonadaceae bacterium]
MGISIRPFRTVCAWLACAALAHPVAADTTPAAWRLGDAIADRSASPAAVATFHIDVLSAEDLRAADTLLLPLPEGPLEATLIARTDRGAENFTWLGRHAADDDPTVILTVVSGALSGLVYAHQHVYELTSLADGRSVLLLLDQDRFPPCDGGIDPARQDLHGHPVETAGATPMTGDLEVDVLVLYTRQARDGAGGTSQIASTAQAAVDAANVAFLNSRMVTRFRTVGIELWDVDETSLGANSSQRLGALRTSAWVQSRRDALGADLVGLLVNDGQGGCGIGYVMRTPAASFASWAFQVTARNCAVGNLTYAHEHGHNMGFEHDPANGTSPGNASFPWSFGHFHDSGTSQQRFRTVMSYSTPCDGSCPRRAYFSNPEVLYQGERTGIGGERDNARSGDLVYDIVRLFRTRVKQDAIFADDFEAG